MRFLEPVRMVDGGAAPVWARSKRSGNFSLIGLLVGLLALLGVATIVLRFTDHSFAAGGARIDKIVDVPVNAVKGVFGKKDAEPAAPAEADAPAEAAAEAPTPAATDAAAPAPAAPAPAKK